MKSKIIENNTINKIESSEEINNNINFKNTENIISSYTSLGGYANSFCVFNSIDNILSLIYTDYFKSIIYYNIIDCKEINKIKNAHNNYINNFIHYLDKKNKRDLILSLSCIDNNIKLWYINDLICLLNIKGIYTNGNLFSACFLNENNEIYILTSNCNWLGTPDLIKVFDIMGNKVNNINDSNDRTLFIDSYYDKKWTKNYIITGNKGYIKSFDYFKNKIYHKYCDNDNMSHLCAIIYDKEELVKLIDSCYDGNIRIWNFNTGELLNKIRIYNKEIYGICLWNDEYILAGCKDKTIKLVDLKEGKIKKHLFLHDVRVVSIKTLNHPKYGECFISQGADNNRIILWRKMKTI